VDELPAEVITLGTREVQHERARIWAELASGAVIHVVDRKMGRHKGWIVPSPEPGYQAVPVSCAEFGRRTGTLLDRARDGEVFEITDYASGGPVIRGYLQWCPAEPLARLRAVLTFAKRRTRTGRVPLARILPTELEAR
jgi:hypothetical protein